MDLRLQNDIHNSFHIFIEGSGGSGKSYLLSALYHYCTYVLNSSITAPTADDIAILKIAPTGIAAVNINGTTIHSAFNIPITNSQRTYISGRNY